MNTTQPAKAVHCPACQGINPPTAKTCWLCRQPLSAPETPSRAASAATPSSRTDADFRTSFACLMLSMALAVIGIGLEEPGVGIALAVLLTPAVIRTLLISRDEARHGRPQSVPGLLAAVFGSVLVVITIGVAAAATFCAMCFVGYVGGAAASSPFAKGSNSIVYGLAVGGIVGGISALVVAVILIRRLWPRKKT